MVSVKIKTINLSSEPRSRDSQSYLFVDPYGWRINAHLRLWRPPTDVFETEEKIIVRVEIAGMADGELNIQFDNQILSIQGVRTENANKLAYHQMEIHFGQFSTEIIIPTPINVENIEAVYNDGLLWVYLPKARAKTIHISPKDD